VHQRLGLHLTDRCQLDCQHCLRDPGLKPLDLPLPLVLVVLDQARAVYGIRQVSLTGGEPTLHPQFAQILDAIAARDMVWDMVSNGQRMATVCGLMHDQPARRRAFKSLTLSLDGATEVTHDRIRGVGSYRQVMAAAALCHGEGLRFGIQMAVHAVNEPEMEQLGLLAANLGAICVSFALTQPTGTRHDAQFFLPPAGLRRIRARAERLAETLRIQVVLPEGHFEEQPFHVCSAFRSETLHVGVRGDLTLCCLHSGIPSDGNRSDVGGDLAKMSLVDAHARLLGIIHDAQAERLRTLSQGPVGDWDHFPCNQCLKSFGRPHWSADGAAGPPAARERWKSLDGAAPDRAVSPKLRVIP
jgi:MoaA/NifB/PqqE/SkfB family radical SAM enzyme